MSPTQQDTSTPSSTGITGLSTPPRPLQDKKAVVLGGSRGIGKAVAMRLARDGASVALTFHHSAEAARAVAAETGGTAHQVDSGDRAAVAAYLAERGPIDLLVINAGVAVLGDPLELEAAAIDRLIDVNVRGPYHAAIEGARHMVDGGRIVIVGSVNADRIPFPGGSAYAMSKAALKGLVQGLARDLGARKITVNNVQPGPVDTDMNPADGPMKDLMHQFMAIQRHIEPREIAGMVSYLASDDAAMVTGASLTIDGGFGA